jgi:hypothetical protein
MIVESKVIPLPTKKPRLLVVIDSDLKETFERLCLIENRSMSNMIVYLIQQAIDKAEREGKL